MATCDQSVPKTTPNIAPPTADRRMRGKPMDTRPVPASGEGQPGPPAPLGQPCCRCATLSDVLPWLQGIRVSSHVERMRNPASNRTRQMSPKAERGGAGAAAFGGTSCGG